MKKPQRYVLASWNVNGIRAAEKKGFFDWLLNSGYDIACLQETKAHIDQLTPAILHPDGYESYWNSAERKGYSGVAVYTKISPTLSMSNFGSKILDGEGRILLLEYADFYLFNVYFPNGGQGPERLKFKLKFYGEFLKLAETFRKKKPVVICGDVNTAHQEIDLARPKENINSSGFMPIERKWLDELEAAGYIDTFRMFNKEGGNYSWWDYKTAARDRNVGWRIDYFYVSEEISNNVVRAWIEPGVSGSDHCPVGLELKF